MKIIKLSQIDKYSDFPNGYRTPDIAYDISKSRVSRYRNDRHSKIELGTKVLIMRLTSDDTTISHVGIGVVICRDGIIKVELESYSTSLGQERRWFVASYDVLIPFYELTADDKKFIVDLRITENLYS